MVNLTNRGVVKVKGGGGGSHSIRVGERTV
jgi:hypothetical protein